MSGVNKVILVGNLGADPESKDMEGGQAMTKFTIATSDEWTDKQGEKQSKTEWHKIVCWGKLAELCGKYLNKGRQVYLEGKLQTRSWEAEDGSTKYMTEVVANTVQFLGGADRAENKTASAPTKKVKNYAPGADLNEEIPF